MEKRYQVFVSSTYEDLKQERTEIMQALLELDCIPAGMELFPAANEDQWSLIKKVIDDCDYYIVVIGGRYGSVDGSGLSFTEKEYRYAVETKKPILAFLHKDFGNIPFKSIEQTDHGRERLAAFRKTLEERLVKYWTTPADLGSVVSRSLVRLIKTHPGIGWVKGDLVANESAAQEILKLKKQIEGLQGEMTVVIGKPPSGTEDLEQGNDIFKIDYDFKAGEWDREVAYVGVCTATWDQIFSTLAPTMIHEASEAQLEKALNLYIEKIQDPILRRENNGEFKEEFLSGFSVHNDSLQQIKMQLRALGLIAKSLKQRSIKDHGTYWTLTPYGDELATRLVARKRRATES